jgi:hypothetical protein
MNNYQEHERKLVSSFIIPERQSRYLELSEKLKRRKAITRSLAHFKHLDPGFIVRIAPREQHVPEILRLLKNKGRLKTAMRSQRTMNLMGKKFFSWMP